VPVSQLVGVALAIVTDNSDPDNRGRVKVSLPWHDEPNVSIWARLVLSLHSLIQETPEIPNIGDEVLVAFDRGDIQFPYVIGKPWNGI
jgi:uncharacterized protein involved in type VI secretion and phage assembly